MHRDMSGEGSFFTMSILQSSYCRFIQRDYELQNHEFLERLRQTDLYGFQPGMGYMVSSRIPKAFSLLFPWKKKQKQKQTSFVSELFLSREKKQVWRCFIPKDKTCTDWFCVSAWHKLEMFPWDPPSAFWISDQLGRAQPTVGSAIFWLVVSVL